MRLLRVEVRRLLARRLFRAMVALALVAVALTLGKSAYDSHPPSAAQVAQAEKTAADQRRLQPPIGQQIQACEQAKKAGNGPPPDFDCAQQVHVPQASDYLDDRIFRFRAAVPSGVTGFAVMLALLGFVVGASFIGAEWSLGTLGVLLTWEPRRLRVLAAKATGLAAGLAAAGVAVLAAYLAGAYGVAAWRGDTSGVTQGLLVSTGLTALRGVALGVGAGLGGFAVAGTLRSTAATFGLGFAYFVGAELLLRNLWRGSPAWLLTSNVAAWLIRDFHLNTVTCPPSRGNCTETSVALGQGRGAAYLGVLVLAALIVWAVAFRRRDVP